MVNKVKVSVCVVTYNQQDFIAECLESIINQKGDFELEVIVSDDCSTDKTAEIVDAYISKYPLVIRRLESLQNLGATKNFLTVHEQARGDFVCHCDGDDFWYPNKVQTQLEVFKQDDEVVQVWNCTDIVDDKSNVVNLFPSKVARFLYPTILSPSNVASSYALVGHHSSQMYKRSARNVQVYTEVVLDYWVAFLIAKNGKSVYLKDILSAYRVTSADSVTRNKSKRRVTVDALALHLNDIIKYFPEYKPEAASNALGRYMLSKLAGHDTDEIENCVRNNKSALRFRLVAYSLWCSILQKIKL